MVQSSPKHLAAIGRDFCDHLVGLGFSEEQVLQGTGLSRKMLETPDEMVPTDKLVKILDNGISLTGDDLVPLRWAQNRRFASLGLIGYLGRTSADVRTVMLNVTRFSKVISESINIDTSELDSAGLFKWRFDVGSSIDTGILIEVQTTQFISGINALVPRTMVPKSVTFRHHRSKHAADVQKLLGCPVKYGGRWNAIEVHLADLDLPLTTSDENLHKVLLRHAEMVLEQQPHNRSSIEIEVERAIADCMAVGHTSANHVARELGMSSRTLARRLGEAGTSYQEVLSNFRKALAERYLKKSNMSQSEIAYLLGYSDVSSFASAFKRWTGQSPGESRQAFIN